MTIVDKVPIMYPVLDKGYVAYVDHMGDDEKIVNAARQSYAGKGKSADRKLLKYLMTEGHNTPFEHCVVTVEIRAPIFVIRQWHRHRTQSYSEVSGRYVELDMGYYVPETQNIGKQSKENHQGRDLGDVEHSAHLAGKIRMSCEKSNQAYQDLLKEGVPRELARSVLPVATYSQYWATANLHNWLGFLWERMDGHAQYEIRVYANSVYKVLCTLYPITMELFKEKMIVAGRMTDG